MNEKKSALFRTAFCLCCLLLLGACVKNAPVAAPEVKPALVEGGFMRPGGEAITAEDFVTGVSESQYVLVGETHNSFCDHLSQARIIELMAKKGLNPVIGLEMVSKEKQGVLDKFNAGELATADLPSALGWNNKGGWDFEMYKPIFEMARAYNIPIYGLNLPREVINAARMGGLDALNNKKYEQSLPKHVIMPMDVQRVELEKTYMQHEAIFNAGKKPIQQSQKQLKLAKERFILSQALWDSAMAENAYLLQKETKRPVVIFAGAGHVEHGWGIGYRLSAADMPAKITLVMPWRLEPTPASPTRSVEDPSVPPVKTANFYFYCPARVKSNVGMTIVTTNDSEHIQVESVEEGSLADKAGIKAGDLILKAGDRLITNPYDLHMEAVLAAAKKDKTMNLLLERDGKNQNAKIKFEKGTK